MREVKVLNVAEKPSVAKEIVKHLSNNQSTKRCQSFSIYNSVTSFPYCIQNTRCNMFVTSVRGHVMTLEFPSEYRDWNAINPEVLYSAAVRRSVSEGNEDIVKNLTHYAKMCNWLVLWLDCDREGEGIAYEVIEICTKVNPRMSIYRAVFSALARRDIVNACQNLQQPNQNLAHAVEARSEIDLRIGASFTRFMTLRYQRRLEMPSGIISYGPCQFPTLGFVVDVFLEVESFIPEAFWSIKVYIEKGESEKDEKKKNIVEFLWKRNRIFNRLVVFILYELCMENPQALVTKVDGKVTYKRKPLPLNTVEMNKCASQKLRISSHRCMQVAEHLYNKGIISYPRTETDSFSSSVNLMELIKNQSGNSSWGNYANTLLSGKYAAPRAGKNDDKAHPPIHPIKSIEREDCENEEEWKLYDFVVRHFLACCSEDAKGVETKIEIEIAGETFHTSGLIVLERNYLDIYPYESWNTKNLPEFRLYERLLPKSIVMTEGKTEPPSLLTEAELISRMDKYGIGTDATMHEHIQTIQERHYAYKNEGGYFVPTTLGVALVKGYMQCAASAGMDLSKPELRAKMEADMSLIARGVAQKGAVLSRHISIMRGIFRYMCENASILDGELFKHFSPLGSSVLVNGILVQNNFTACGKCNALMDFKKNGGEGGRNSSRRGASGSRRSAKVLPKRAAGRSRSANAAVAPTIQENRFLICQNYQNGCRTILVLPRNGALAPHFHRCPICNFQVIKVTNEATNKSHTICPFCFRNPPTLAEQQINGGADTGGGGGIIHGDFRCFMCKHQSCPLALWRDRN